MSNVILLSIDCLRGDRVGFMGHRENTTPFLNSLSANGRIFENAFATGPATTYSMPGLMTGTYPSFFGGYPPIPDQIPTLAEILNNSGYSSYGIHSNPWLHPNHGFDSGFDNYLDLSKSTKLTDKPSGQKTKCGQIFNDLKSNSIETAKAVYYQLPTRLREKISRAFFVSHYLLKRTVGDAKQAVDVALEILSNSEEDDDLFLWLHFMDVHRPYTLTDDYTTLRDIWKTARVTQPAYTNPTRDDQNQILKLYDQSVGYVDNQIRRLHNSATNRTDDSLFIITSDHGEEFGEHGDWFHRKFKLYDELIHVPLLIAGPSVPQDRVSHLTSLADVVPTVLDWANIDIPDTMSGHSMLGDHASNGGNARETLIAEVYDPDRDKFAIRSQKWKLITDRNETRDELYRISSDPREENNKITEMDVPEILLKARDEYLNKRTSTSNSQISSNIQHRLQELGYLE